MTKINKDNVKGLTQEKKIIFKKLIGTASSPRIDLNKIRDELKYAKN